MCLKEENIPDILFTKLSFDKTNFFEVPDDQQSIDKHPNFKRELRGYLDGKKSGCRNLKFSILNSKNELTNEAKLYLNADLKFVICGQLLEKGIWIESPGIFNLFINS